MDRELKNLTLNISQLAALSGVHRQTAAARLQNLPVAGGHESNLKLYRVVDIVSAFLALPPPVAEGEMDAHERKAWYQSERERLKFEQETAQLIPASDVRREFAIWAKAVVQVLETLPDILERDCGLQPAAVSRVQSIIDDLRDQIEGWTENDILRYCRLSSGRNYATELERQLGITLERIDEKNPDGIGTHLRYRFSCRGDVLKVITHINHLANINDHNGLSQQEIADILKLYPDAFNAA